MATAPPSAIWSAYKIPLSHCFQSPFAHSNCIPQSVLCTVLDISVACFHNQTCKLFEEQFRFHPPENMEEQTLRRKSFEVVENRKNDFQSCSAFSWERCRESAVMSKIGLYECNQDENRKTSLSWSSSVLEALFHKEGMFRKIWEEIRHKTFHTLVWLNGSNKGARVPYNPIH